MLGKLMIGIFIVAEVIAHDNGLLAADLIKPPSDSLVRVSPTSVPGVGRYIIPSTQLFSCQSAPITGVHVRADSSFTAVLLGGKVVVGYQKAAAPPQKPIADTVFFECGKEIHRTTLTAQGGDAAAASISEIAAPESAGVREIVLSSSSAATGEAQEPAAKVEGQAGERQYAVQVSVTEPNLFICDGTGPMVLRLPAHPYVNAGEAVPSGSNHDAAYLTVNAAAFGGNGEYKSARDLWVNCGGIETKLQLNPEKIPGQIVVVK